MELAQLLQYLPVIGTIITAITGITYATYSLLAYRMKLRFLRHALDERGTRAAVELAHALQPDPLRSRRPAQRRLGNPASSA